LRFLKEVFSFGLLSGAAGVASYGGAEVRYLFSFVTIVGLVTVACNDGLHSGTSQSDQQSTIQEATIPSDVSFEIIGSDSLPGVIRNLNVRLSRKVSEQTLRAIALKLKAQPPAYDRTIIYYYLPGMTVGAGAWATTHFTPELEVRILGLTVDDEKKLLTQPEPTNREMIGRWLDESPFVGSRITIFREKGKLFIEQMYKDGSGHKKELVERKSPLGRRFNEIERSRNGDHWILGSDGNLQVRDNDGLIGTAAKIE
jgi:hypothetical protein